MYSVPRTVLNTLQDHLISYTWQLDGGLVLSPSQRQKSQVISEWKNQDSNIGLSGFRNHGDQRGSSGSPKAPKCCHFWKSTQGSHRAVVEAVGAGLSTKTEAKGAGGSREATGSPPACVNVCVFKVAALISNVTGSKNGFWPLLSEMVAEKRVTEGLPISEYPMWSELTHVQLALEPTAWAADSYFQGNDNDNVSSIFMCRQRRS